MARRQNELFGSDVCLRPAGAVYGLAVLHLAASKRLAGQRARRRYATNYLIARSSTRLPQHRDECRRRTDLDRAEWFDAIIADDAEAITFLNRAVELDPGLARAWVELYHAHDLMGVFGDPESNREAAADVAERAVRLDPSDAEAHAVFGMSLANKGDMSRAKSELDTALRLAPGSSEILTFYSGFAARFGEPERGAQMVDQVMRLDPNYPMWTSNFFAPAYFMAGRYEDAVKMLERMAPNNYQKWNWVVRSSSLAALGRTDEANASVIEALKQHPDVTVESMINEPGLSTMERSRFIETMPLAGFPTCATPEALAKLAKPVRLPPECEAAKANPLGQP